MTSQRHRFDKLFTGIAIERPANVNDGSMKGLEDIGPEDTGDCDYGRLLDRQALRVSSPARTSIPSVVRSRVAA